MASGASSLLRRWQKVKEIPGNAACAECCTPTAAGGTDWVVLDYGVLICVKCAGAHRALGSHISKVRSVSHDKFTDAELDWIESLGNAKSAGLWEAALPSGMRRPLPDSPDCIRRMWLRQKYDEQRFTAGTEHFGARPPHESQAGWLLKQGALVPSWKRRYFTVRPGIGVCYHTDESCAEMRGCFPLADATMEPDADRPLTLRLRARKPGGGTSLLVAKAETSAEAEAWTWAVFQLSHLPQSSDADEVEAFSRKRSIFGGGKRRSTLPAGGGGGGGGGSGGLSSVNEY